MKEMFELMRDVEMHVGPMVKRLEMLDRGRSMAMEAKDEEWLFMFVMAKHDILDGKGLWDAAEKVLRDSLKDYESGPKVRFLAGYADCYAEHAAELKAGDSREKVRFHKMVSDAELMFRCRDDHQAIEEARQAITFARLMEDDFMIFRGYNTLIEFRRLRKEYDLAIEACRESLGLIVGKNEREIMQGLMVTLKRCAES